MKVPITLRPAARAASTVWNTSACANPLSTPDRTRSLAASIPKASHVTPARRSFSSIPGRTVSTRA
jgi:hypothetical protein